MSKLKSIDKALCLEILERGLMPMYDNDEKICFKCGGKKILVAGPHSLTCDLAADYIECPSDCKGTGGCHPQPKKYICISCEYEQAEKIKIGDLNAN